MEFGIERHQVYCLAGLAAASALRGDQSRARLLWRGVETAERGLRFRIVADERNRYEQIVGHIAEIRERNLNLQEAVTVALSGSS